MKKKLKDFFPLLFFFLLIFWVFQSWFSLKSLAAKDWFFFYPQNLKELPKIPYLWNNQGWGGMGRVSLYNWSIFYFYWPAKFLSFLGLSWSAIEKIIWFWPFLTLAIFSSWYLMRTLFPRNVFWFFGSLVYLLNTYILMLVGGGQMGTAMAYAVAPLVLGLFINLINELKSSRVKGSKQLVLAGLVLALQMMFDPRISLLTMGAVVLYFVFSIKYPRPRLRLAEGGQVSGINKYLASLIVPTVIAALLHSFWLLPALLARRAALPTGYGEAGWVEFLSFADFSNSLSLLHPNWPENIFGKTYFMRPEFLVIPILTYASLLFISFKGPTLSRRRRNALEGRTLLYFAFLGLLGAFLAKGSKPPFGGVYLSLFKYFPGMSMFRDPTKFYLLVTLSYSILIPFSLAQISRRLKRLSTINYQLSTIKHLLFIIFILYWLFLIRPAWLGQLGGTFKAKEVPQEYVVLKDFIHNQEEFFRTLWIPIRQRFGFYSNNHPAIEGSELPSEEELSVMGVKYVIIPYDSEGEIFLKDREYDPKLRLALEEELDKIPWLKKIKVTDKIAIYETPSYKDHFWTERVGPSLGDEPGQGPTLAWQMVNPTKYLVQVQNASQPFNLVFSETYDELWQARLDSRPLRRIEASPARLAKIGEKTIPSTLYNNLNSFTIDQTGDFEMTVEFTAQKYVYWGLVVSGITMLFIIYSLLMS